MELLNAATLAALSITALSAGAGALPVWYWALASFTSVILWLRAATFLRAAPAASLFVIELRDVAAAVTPFLAVLLVVVLAFASSFNFHSKFMHSSQVGEDRARRAASCPSLIDGTKPVDAYGVPCEREAAPASLPAPYLEGFADSVVFSWLLTLGEFDTENNAGSAVGTALFVAASLLAQVVMLNLLVAIFSATHAEVTSTRARQEVRANAELV